MKQSFIKKGKGRDLSGYKQPRPLCVSASPREPKGYRMKLKFDSNPEYQLEAIQGVTDLFEGLPRNREGFETKTSIEITAGFTALRYCAASFQ